MTGGNCESRVHLRDNMYSANFSKNIKFPVRPAGRLLLALSKYVRKLNQVVCDPVCTLTIDIPSLVRLHGMVRLITLYYNTNYIPEGRIKLLAVISISN